MCLQRTVLCYWQTATLHHWWVVGKAKHRGESELVFTEQNKTRDKALVTVIEHMMTLAGMQIGPQ